MHRLVVSEWAYYLLILQRASFGVLCAQASGGDWHSNPSKQQHLINMLSYLRTTAKQLGSNIKAEAAQKTVEQLTDQGQWLGPGQPMMLVVDRRRQ